MNAQEIANLILNGTESYVTLIDPRTDKNYALAQIKSCQIDANMAQDTVQIAGSRRTRHVTGNHEITGSMTMYKINDEMSDLILSDLLKSKTTPEYNLVIKRTSLDGKRVSIKRITGVKFTNLPLVNFTTSELSEESYNFVVDGDIIPLQKMK